MMLINKYAYIIPCGIILIYFSLHCVLSEFEIIYLNQQNHIHLIPMHKCHLFLVSLFLLLWLGAPWCLKTTVNLTSSAISVDYSFDGNFIVVVTAANSVVVYDTTNFFVQLTYTPASGTAKVARFSRNNTIIAVGQTNGLVVLLTGQAPFSTTPLTSFTPKAGSDQISDLDFSYGGDKMVVCFSNNNNFQIVDNWGLSTRSFTRDRATGQKQFDCQWSANDDVCVVNDNKQVRVYNVPAAPTVVPTQTSKIAAGSMDFTDCAIRPTTATPIKIVATGGNNNQRDSSYFSNNGGTITESQHSFPTPPTAAVNTACYSGDATYYAVGGADKKVWILEEATNAQFQVMADSVNTINDCDFTASGDYMAAATGLANSVAYVLIYAKTCFFCAPGFYQSGVTSCSACNVAMTACSMCTNSTNCISCFQGYYRFNSSQCSTCNSILPGCSTCKDGTTCIQCNHGYYLSGTSCLPCTNIFPGCLTCNSTNCFLCEHDYYKVGVNCTKCSSAITNCLRCNATNFCMQCAMGYFLPVSGGVVGGTTCTACDVKCLACYATSTNCTLCARGYYFNSNVCSPCSSNCLECSPTACLDCALGYYITTTTCTACTQPCASCATSANSCLSCTTGYYLSGTSCLPCANNCSLCRSATNCTGCNVGYYLTATDTCLSCALQYAGCQQCQLGACLSCDQTRYLASATSCTVCNTAMPGCQYCSNSTVCTACGVGYYHSGTTGAGACTRCVAKCQVCSSGTSCSACATGYFLSGTTCTACTSPCVTCSTLATTCLSCQSQYYFNGASCIACTTLTNCLNCYSASNCTDCKVGFYSNAGTCTACPSNCLSCNSTNCLACNIGYYLSGVNACSSCALNCSTCTSTSNCLSCNVGFYYDSALASNQCVTCTTFNSKCLTCIKTACYSCANGFYLNSSNNCSSCGLNVTYCSICSTALTCTRCQDGYYLASASSCLSCSSLTGCLSCSGAATCTLCASGYYLNAGACYACPSGCSACTSALVCTICDASSYLSSNSCLPCQDVLTGCSSCTSASTCLSCSGGYLMTSGACQPCSVTIPACSLCNTTGVCQSCQQGYFLNSTNNCQLCSLSSALAGCLLCNSSSTCQYCSSGYYLSGGTCSLCSPSLPGCEQCASAAVCLDCASGYYLNGTSNGCLLCQTNLPGCIFCSSNNTCIQCQGGYYLTGGSCLPCAQPGCQICNATTPTNCITCNSGYYLTGNSCAFCPQTGCLDCNSSSCLSCQSGYYLSTGACSLCSSAMNGCSKCSSAGVCIECQSLFYLSGGSCLVCSSAMIGCSFCTTGTTCLACDGGYYLSGSSCLACSTITGCLICNGSSSCLTCTAGYYLSASTCLQCSAALQNCFQCYNNSVCIACQSGYVTTASGGCQAMQVSSGSTSTSGPAQLSFRSIYVNASVLKHALSVSDKSTVYENTDTVDWITVAKIYVQTKAGSTLLTILSYELSADKATLFFYTNNPVTVQSTRLPVTNKGRILAGQSMNQLNVQSSLSLPKSVINNVLPSVLISQDLSMSYSLNESEFYITYVNSQYSYYYYIFGLLVVIFCLIYGFCRATCLGLYSRNIEIFGHALALKTMSLVVFPSYAEYVNFCLGFMAVDLPWLNNMLPSVFSNQYDVAPTGYFFFFRNMNLAAMHLFTTAIFLVLFVMAYCLLNDTKSNEIRINDKKKNVVNFKFKAFKEFLMNFFGFGLAFAGFSSIIGSFLNYSSTLSLNGVFYILGVIIYGAIFSQAFACLILSHRLCRLRMVLKATFLAGAGLNPLYLAAVCLIVDLILIMLEYKLRRKQLVCPRAWLVSNILIWGALTSYYFVPDSFLTIGLVITLVILSFGFEIYHFCKEKGLDQHKHIKLFEQEQNIVTDGHFWNLQKKNQSQVEINQKDYSKNSPGKNLVFEVSNLQGDDANVQNMAQTKVTGFQGNDTRTTKFSTNPFEPKRRTRKFKQAAGKTKDSFTLTINGKTGNQKGKDELSDDFYIEQ